jgi:hypothetical protein
VSRQNPRGRRVALPPVERVARRVRLNATALVAIILPVLTVGTLALVRPDTPAVTAHPPTPTGLNLAILTCPSSLTGDPTVSVASASGASGSVELTSSGDGATTTVEVPADRPAVAEPGDGPVTVRGTGRMAPGLIAGRQDEGPAAVVCRAPASDQWFTGLGAAARHQSVLELVNPDPGPAVADITLIGPRGPVDAPSLRGITVPGGRSLRVDLSEATPIRGELAAHVVVSRGRLGAYAADSFDELGHGEAGTDWLAPQDAGDDLTLLGLPAGEGTRALVIANAGDDEVRAIVRVVTKDSAFRPKGLDEVRVAPGSVIRVPLTGILGTAIEDGAVGLHVEASHPVTATLRSFVAGDLSHTVPLPVLTGQTQTILPDGRATVVLAGEGVGTAEVLARLAGGGKKVVTVDLAPGRTSSVRLPPRAVLVQVTPGGTTLRGAVVVTEGGAAVLGLRDLVMTGLVPDVRPALP